MYVSVQIHVLQSVVVLFVQLLLLLSAKVCGTSTTTISQGIQVYYNYYQPRYTGLLLLYHCCYVLLVIQKSLANKLCVVDESRRNLLETSNCSRNREIFSKRSQSLTRKFLQYKVADNEEDFLHQLADNVETLLNTSQLTM